ncbi:hypothetical protein AAFN60_02620 [Roseibacillus persicicus]|uniref:hypothetical protein n=1 Tax=Roseibacillus persicicus TaxID=454148 RepID=UPI001679B64C|nr:hypothetical protein [Roseibacillus persicicus]
MAWITCPCELCGLEDRCNVHHLIPRKCHSKKWFRNCYSREEMKTRLARLCHTCHRQVHDFIPNEIEMGKKFNTIDLLLTHPQVANYVAWRRRRG